ncbi:hypothetical protein ADIARSV_1217 [Arcticibacter svalbardensis MN12-7]|uniref:IrrE N-terminal-like domain-containing protein n=1 Tax=Arcticibacter svalbardensis MN12-7 TaxID=1150600 RepID=R9GV68_9SPHI|nr:hypothetical protein [Arcticibacter svalbardensis]EOR95611.1 hypothetical protein ADIARSV_1217 [Arcticibacter svalbardensis MN12-7]
MSDFNVNKLLQSLFQDNVDLDIRSKFEEKLVDYKLSKTKALKILNIDKDVFEEIVSGTAKQPNLINIVKLAGFIECDINEVIKAVLKNQNTENIIAIDRSRKVTFLLKNFDIKTLTKLGFFDGSDDIDVLIKRTMDFFGYQSIQDFEENLSSPLFSKTKRTFSDKMKDFWIRSAYQCFKVINNPNEYDRNRLKEIIVKIKPYSQDIDNGLYVVCKALYNIGVTVIVQNYLSTTQVRGGTFEVNGKPCIVLTDFNKKYPTIWFTLLHELYHVLYDMQTISTNLFHLTGEADLFLIEDKADSFARDFFFSEEKFHYIKKYINNHFLVSKFAKDNEIQVSIIYSWFARYQDILYGKKNYYAAFHEYYPTSSTALSRLNPVTWDQDNLKEISLNIKSIFEINH